MTIRMTELTRYSARLDGDSFALSEALFDPRTGALRFVVLDTGGWFVGEEVLVAARSMGTIDTEAREWQVKAPRAEVEAAPRWSESSGTMQGLATQQWPPLIVGPFGATYAPLLLDAQVSEAAGGQSGSGRKPAGRGHRISKVAGLATLSDWIGLEAFGADGVLGQISDFILAPERNLFTGIVISHPHGLTRRETVVPFARMKHRAQGGAHVVFDLTQDALEAGIPV